MTKLLCRIICLFRQVQSAECGGRVNNFLSKTRNGFERSVTRNKDRLHSRTFVSLPEKEGYEILTGTLFNKVTLGSEVFTADWACLNCSGPSASQKSLLCPVILTDGIKMFLKLSGLVDLFSDKVYKVHKKSECFNVIYAFRQISESNRKC